MYLYTFTITYVGNDPFLTALWSRLTRGQGSMPQQIQLTQAQATTLRTQATAAGFALSNIKRIPVVATEDVP